MKVIAAVMGIALALLAGWLALPLVRGASGTAPGAGTGTTSGGSATTTRREPLDVPLPEAQRAKQDLDLKRLPFYRILRDQYSSVILKFGVTGDQDTLDLVVAQSDNDTLSGLLTGVVGPNAKTYGFRRVRFFVRSPQGSIDPVTIVAESTLSDAGSWTTWRK